MLDNYAHNPYDVSAPALLRVPFVFNSPHSGRYYAPEFLAMSRLQNLDIRKSEDFLVDELFNGVVPLGAPMLKAIFPRAWLDVNREPYELDPKMFDEPLPNFVNTRSTRVASGLGTIAQIVCEDMPIYSKKLGVEEGLNRIETLYKPYHETLRHMLAKAMKRFGHSVLIDCHSMPSSQHRYGLKTRSHTVRADFVLGDKYGASCAPELTKAAQEFLTDLGYCVSINKPYAGGFITSHYGKPESGLHALQVEINRALYMDELNMKRSSNFENLQRDLTTFSSRLMAIPEFVFKSGTRQAAE
ncbi:MAG: N-formylglutamate amidohydrolase [Nitratireductor sp.]